MISRVYFCFLLGSTEIMGSDGKQNNVKEIVVTFPLLLMKRFYACLFYFLMVLSISEGSLFSM